MASPPIENGTLVENDGRIVYAGPRAGAPDTGDDVELGDVIVTPGLINTHCHLELAAMRGFLDGLGFREWILRLTHARRAVLTTDMMLDASRLSVAEGLSFGVTTFADTGDSGTGFDAMLEYGVRGICYREVFGPDPSQAAASVAELEKRVEEMRARATGLVRVGVSPHAPYTVSDELFQATSALAQRFELPMAIHIAESQLEADLVSTGAGAFAEGLRKRGIATPPRARTPVALLERLKVLERQPLLIHCVRVDDQDIAAIVAHDCAVAHCPASNAKLGHGIAPLADMLAAGARLGLGSDSVASNDRMSLLDEARVAALFASARESRPDVVSASKALELLTIEGARALGLHRDVGTLEKGKYADFAAFPIPDTRRPVHDPVSALVYSLAGVSASFVAVAGVPKVRDGRLLHGDAGLAERVQRVADQLAAWRQSEEGRRT